MNQFAKAADQAARTFVAVMAPVFSIVLAILIAVALLAALGFPVRIVKTFGATELAYLAGAVWLWRRAAP